MTYNERMITVGIRLYRADGDPVHLHLILNYIEGVMIPTWFTAVDLARNEADFCADCGQAVELCNGICDTSEPDGYKPLDQGQHDSGFWNIEPTANQ